MKTKKGTKDIAPPLGKGSNVPIAYKIGRDGKVTVAKPKKKKK